MSINLKKHLLAERLYQQLKSARLWEGMSAVGAMRRAMEQLANQPRQMLAKAREDLEGKSAHEMALARIEAEEAGEAREAERTRAKADGGRLGAERKQRAGGEDHAERNRKIIELCEALKKDGNPSWATTVANRYWLEPGTVRKIWNIHRKKRDSG